MFPFIAVMLVVGLVGATRPLHAQVEHVPLSPVTSEVIPVQPIEPANPVPAIEPAAQVIEEDEEPGQQIHYDQAIDHPRIKEVSEKTEKVYRFYPKKGSKDAENTAN